jgi:deoxyribodipyrimidine photo-lyase
VIFEKDEVVKADGSAYSVFTPYSKAWMQNFSTAFLDSYPSEEWLSNLQKEIYDFPVLEKIGFQPSNFDYPSENPDKDVIKQYHITRNNPWQNGTTRMGIHLRFGTVSVREMIRLGYELNRVWLNELIWREFYMMILFHHPYVVKLEFKPKYRLIPWRNSESDFQRWKDGLTGFPIVDAGMRELKQTDYMHNRVRMITASFLTKHLLLDWRWGEAWFAEKLLDYELASNNGNWQWAAGSGCDAAPYFRVFNPETQAKKFDPEGKYIQRWLPEYGSPAYPKPMVDHKEARERALKTYKHALNSIE